MEKKQIVPLGKWGQNYLIDKNIVHKIVAEFNPKIDDLVIEIGPGKGALTKLLSQKLKKFYAVEIDKRVINELKDSFPNLILINKDFLEIDLNGFIAHKQKIRIIGNIPYNLTSPIIFKLIEHREIINDAVLMVQYEVAKRIFAKPQTKEYGILSVLLNFFSETKFCFKVSANVFRPKPKVDSAVIHIFLNKKLPEGIPPNLFIKTVKAAFGNRRKTLKNSFANSIYKEIKFDNIDFDLSRRAESLTVDEFISITRFIANNAEKNN
ncbi:16S rRNA (adenine(1518)-N(6)/adenine(1519)-N(6))-dimethyltransferase RsmA [Melioribacteraceae bacterium 4301-Me]|uniref:16S rRNA (adenine(1518)-N(6)/adenine(1519)-N(6))- dimethyltransferase RsmA n=1 Tax=Pyranulibacter aquaticus TaxID=3163344 RepID=UPI00359B914B